MSRTLDNAAVDALVNSLITIRRAADEALRALSGDKARTTPPLSDSVLRPAEKPTLVPLGCQHVWVGAGFGFKVTDKVCSKCGAKGAE